MMPPRRNGCRRAELIARPGNIIHCEHRTTHSGYVGSYIPLQFLAAVFPLPDSLSSVATLTPP
eukprot:727220-Rhodomonas_salina.2